MNSNIEHQATVDKGLKMKIKRKNVSGANNKAEPKHEIVKPDSGKCVPSTPGGGGCISGGGGGATSSGGGGTTGGSSSVGATSSVSDAGVSCSSGGGGSGGGNAATATTSGVASGPACSASCSSVVVGSGGTNGVLLLTDKMKPSPGGDNNSSNNNNNNNNNNNSSKQEKSPKMKGSHKKEKMKDKTKSSASGTSSISSSSSLTSSSSSSTSSSSATTNSTSTASSSSSSISCPPPPPPPPSLLSSSSSTPCSSSSSTSCPAPSSGADCCVSNGNNTPSSSAAVMSNGLDTSTIYNPVLEPRGGDVPHLKKENPTPDPYEFNAKVEDGFGIPMKKIKVEKVEAACSPMQPELHDMGTDTCSVGVITEPECLGPCEPGTSVTLEGIVWHETENGVLVINVTWRGKTYVGTLLDATKHDWAPPRFNCDSPVSDFESRTPKGRGKRGRGNTATPVNERLNISGGNNNNNSSSNNSSSSNNNNNNSNNNNGNSNNNNNNEGRKLRKGRRCGGNSFQAPASPAKLEHDRSSSLKRKGRPSDLDLSVPSDTCKGSKRCRSSWRGTTSANSNTSTSGNNNNNINNSSSSSINNSSMSSATISLSTSGNGVATTGSASGESTSPVLLKCPEANCNKQYKHINGLRYHQSHAHHSSMLQAQEADENLRDEDAISMEGNITDEEVGRSRKDETNEKGSRKEKIKEELQSDDNIHAEESSTAGDLNQEQISCQSASADEASDEQKVLLDKTTIKSEVTSLGETIKSEKVIKSEHPSSCCASIHPSSGLNVGGSVSKPLPTPQIYQLSGAPMGCLGTGGVSMVTQTNCRTSPMPTMSASSVASSVVSPISSQSLLTSVTTFGTISHVAESCQMDLKDSDKTIKTEKISVVDKSKSKTPTRPIVPAPSPQLMAFPGSVSSSHTGLTSVPTTHTQVSPSLKPIQPKPTILGEPMNINSALVSLKDKKSKQKKKCSKEKELGKCDVPSLKGDHTPKYERTAVIKSVASPPKPGLDLMPKKDSSLMEPPHLISDLSRSTVSSLGCANSVISSQISPKSSLDPSHVTRMTQPPGLLKVGAPIPGLLSTPDRKTPVNDDVQSPAYSDISDANESGSPTQGDTPVKVKEESSSSRKEEKHQGRNSPEPPPTAVPHYGMYGYYGQSSYLVPSVSQPSSHVSQSSASNSVSGSSTVGNHKASTSIKSEPSQGVVVSCHDDKMGVSIEEGMKMGEEKKLKEEKEDPKHKEGAPPGSGGGGGGSGGGGGGSGGSGGGGPSSAAAAAISPHDYPQKWYQQYYAWPQPPHFQYLYGYVDPAFHMHHLADPQYRQQYEKALEDQKRVQHYPGKDAEPCKKQIEFQNKPGLSDDLKVSSHSDIPPNVHTIKSSSHGMALKSNQADKGSESRKIMVEKSLEREREQAIREKKNENHQIMNENFEVKSQMDKSRCEMSEAEAYRMQHNDVRHEGIPHFYMYQQQKLLEQEKRKMEYGPKPDMQPMELMIPKGGHKMLEHGRLIPNDEMIPRDNNTSSNSSNSSKRDLLDMKTKEVMVRDIKPINKPIPDLCQTSDKRMMMMDKLRSPAESQKLKSSYSLSLGNSSSGGSGVIGGGGSGGGGGGGSGGSNSGSNNSNMPPSSSSSSSSSSASSSNSSSSSGGSSVPSSNSNTTVSAATSANYPHYVPYPYMQSPGYSQLHFDAYRQFNPVLGYTNTSYLHPSHLGYRLNQSDVEKEEKNTSSQKNILNQPVLPGTELESSKSAEVIHHSSAASYYEVHKMSELQEKTSSRPSSNCHSSSHPKTSISETSVSPSPNFDKTRDYQNSPPTQRHVHTHHHTHVVGTTFPLYPFTNK